MKKAICLILVGVAACVGTEEPELEREASVSELAGIRLLYSANPREVLVTIQYEPRTLGSCAILGADFAGRVGDVSMTVTQRGAARGDEIDDDCNYPSLALESPPAGGASIELGDGSRGFTIPLGDLLVPRSITRVPEPGWLLPPGQEVTVRVSPAGDVSNTPRIRLVPDQVVLPQTIAGDLVTFRMPAAPWITTGELQLWVGPENGPAACSGCVLSPTPRVIQPFTYQ